MVAAMDESIGIIMKTLEDEVSDFLKNHIPYTHQLLGKKYAYRGQLRGGVGGGGGRLLNVQRSLAGKRERKKKLLTVQISVAGKTTNLAEVSHWEHDKPYRASC